MQIDDLVRGGSPPPPELGLAANRTAVTASWPERLTDTSERFGGWVAEVARDYGPGPVLAAVVVLAVVLGFLWASVSAWTDKRRDPDRLLLPTRRVRRVVRGILRAKRLRLPWMVYWPFFSRLYAGTHALILAVSGGGKGAVVLLPALAYHVIHWCRGRVLRHLAILDPKAEALERLVPLFNKFGWRYFVFSLVPEHPTSAAINVVDNPARARSTALALWPDEKGQEGHFNRKARELFLASCEHTRWRGLWQVRLLTRDVEVLERAAEEDAGLRRAYAQIQEKERANILSTLAGQLSMLDDPIVRRVFDPDERTEQPDYHGHEEPCASVVCMDFEQGEELAPLVEALTAAIYGLMLTAGKPAAKNTKRGRGPGAYSYLDEATSVIKLPKLMAWLSVGRGNRAYTAVCSQDLSQVIHQLGKPAAMSGVNNAQVKVFGQSEDPETMRYAEQVSGMTRVTHEPPRPAPRVWGGQDERAPRRVETIRRPRLQGDHLQEMEWGQFFIKSQGARRRREIVSMPHPDEYWDGLLRRVGAGAWDYDPSGVPTEQLVALTTRLVNDPTDRELWGDPWVPRRAKEVARNVLAKYAKAPAPPEVKDSREPRHGWAINGKTLPSGLKSAEEEREAREHLELEDYGDWVVGGEPDAAEPDDRAVNKPSGETECWFCGDTNGAGAGTCKTCKVDLAAG